MDYVPVPVVPDLLRAKVQIFVDLYRKTRQLERWNAELERRVAERTQALEAAAERLLQSERRRSLALAAGRMGSWDWNIATGDSLWDGGQHRIFGTDPAEFEPTPERVLALVHPEDRERLQQASAHAMEAGTAYNAEFRVIRPDGEVRWCVAGGAPTLDVAGRTTRMSGVTLDITERKRAEEALARVNTELEQRVADRTREREEAQAKLHEMQKMESLGQLTGGVAHDFNNLLMAVLGNLKLLRKHLPDDPRTLRLIDGALQGAERGATLTKRMLAFAKRQQLKPEAVEVPMLVSSITDMLSRSIGPTIRIASEFQPGLPPTLVDPNQLELALLNLALNARDAMPRGGTLTISARQETVAVGHPQGLPPGWYICLAVADTGTGMDGATLKRAAEPFFTTKGPGKGTGLGLSMVHGLAAQSGGMLWMESRLGTGTTMEVWLPATERGAGDQAPAIALPRTRTARTCRVLVVDDDPLVAAGTSAMLEDLGHNVIEASSGARALEALRAGAKVDVVITDYAMPGMTGRSGQVRPICCASSVPVILATGYAELPKGIATRLPCLNKPYQQEELDAQIAKALDVKPTAEVIQIDTMRRAY